MTPDDVREETTGSLLSVLRTHEPNRNRATRIRARSHAQLTRQRELEPPSVGAFWRRSLGPAGVVLAAAAYLAGMARVALHVYGF